MSWVDYTKTSSGGNTTLSVAGGYSGISRSGNTVSGSLGLRFKAHSGWTANSIVGVYGGVKYYAQNRVGGKGGHLNTGDVVYCTAGTSNGDGKHTGETYPWWMSTTVSGTGSGNLSISMSMGWSDWGGAANGSYSYSVPYGGVPGNPTYTVSVSPSRTSATMTMKITDNPSNFWRIHWYDTGGNWKGCSEFKTGTWTYTQSSLTPNTSYNFYTQIGAANDTNLKGSVAKGFTTTGNAPTINSVSPSPSRTSCSLASNSISYDTNAKFKSVSVKYGTSTSYGSTATSTSLSSLTPNTKYYYSMTVTDNFSRTSAAKTGNFTTTGNAPTATGLPVSNITRTGATVSINGTYDTNASWGGWELQYGTSTSYGTTVTNGTLTGLTPNTTYYVRGRFYDNWSRWSGWVTNSFTTTGNAPTLSSVTPDVYRNKAILNYSASYDTNDSYKSLSIKYGTSTSYGSTSTSTTLSNLQPNTTYYYSMTVTSNKNRTSSAKTGSFKTTAYIPSSLSLSASNTLPFTTNLSVSGSGDTNAGITNYTYYYRTKPTKPIYDMAIKSLSDGSTWARIFYHNNKMGTVLFSSINECKNTQTADKYSRLYLLENNTYKGSDGKFEFMLCYPIDAPGKYNRWKQTNAPQLEYNTTASSGKTVAGYQAIHIDWTSNYFGGLERFQSDTSTLGSTWLDGSVGHSNWYYAIGVSTAYQRGIPSAADAGNGGATADVVELWVRIDDATTTSKSMGTSTTAAVSGLAEETEYIFYISATNAAGTNWSSAIDVITPADQAKIRRKTESGWVKGKTYYKKNGAWVKAKKIYIKVDGQWKIGTNYDD